MNANGRSLWTAAIILVVSGVVAARVESHAKGSGHAAGTRDLPAETKVFPEHNHDHVEGDVQYDRVPPAGGAHSYVWLNCGVYDVPVRKEDAVHSLEHGAVWITYRPGLPAADVARLRRRAESSYQGTERYVILSPYRGLSAPVVASAWGAQLQLKRFGDALVLRMWRSPGTAF